MADQATKSFPQIPATVWWGLREKFKKSIPGTVTDSYIATELNVQPSAARSYLAELKKVGLIDEDGKPQPVAKKWRMDETYREASDEIIKSAYPQELIDIADPSEGDRDKAIRWFMNAADLGEGSARNRAATYFLIGASTPPDETPKTKAAARKSTKLNQSAKKPTDTGKEKSQEGHGTESHRSGEIEGIPLNVNVQIHISADATKDQIETIFASMKKYLR